MSGAMLWSPFATLEDARDAARTLLERRLVACANILPGVESMFHFDGEIRSGREVGVLFKTEAGALAEATSALAELHPYDTPAVMGWTMAETPDVTRQWLEECFAETED